MAMKVKAAVALLTVALVVAGAAWISGLGVSATGRRTFTPVGSPTGPGVRVAHAGLGSRTGSGGRAVHAGLDTRTGSGVRAARVAAAAIPPGRGTLVAQVLRSTQMRARPRGPVLATLRPRTQFNSPDVLAVVRVRDGWLGVLSELAGNGRVGWIPESAVIMGRDTYRVRASLSAHTLTVLHAGRVVARYVVGIGSAGSPTPTGRFGITDKLVTNDPGGPYGCCILALSAVAPHAIPGWTGGNRVAIHATPYTETIGEPDSHGCLHVTQAQAHWLVYHVPLGTQAVITG